MHWVLLVRLHLYNSCRAFNLLHFSPGALFGGLSANDPFAGRIKVRFFVAFSARTVTLKGTYSEVLGKGFS